MGTTEIKTGDTLTITTSYGMLPGTHRGRVTGHITGPYWNLSVWVGCRGRHESVAFTAAQIVPDDTPVTDLSLTAQRQFQRGYDAAMADHAEYGPEL